MACERTQEVMLLLDGELSPFEARTLEAHVASCEACARERMRLAALAAAIAREAPPLAAPAALRRRIERAIVPAAPVRAPSRSRAWLSLAASLLLGAAIGGGATWQLAAPGEADVDAAVAVHMRALMANHLTDVASSDQHQVRPWFAGKVPLAPPSPNLDAEGFVLVGGRVDEIEGKPAAAVVYRRRQHVIDLIVAPIPEGAAPRHLVRRGYNVVAWSADGLAYWAVSDLNEDELREFAALIRAAR
jgi:anti-sigma factor RsiW